MIVANESNGILQNQFSYLIICTYISCHDTKGMYF